LALWIAIICMGRIIGFTTTRAAAAPPATNQVNFDDFLGGAPQDKSGPPATPPHPK